MEYQKLIGAITVVLLLQTSLGCTSKAVNEPMTTDQAKVDVLHQKIEVMVDWESQKLMGKTELTFKPIGTTDRIGLDAANLKINAIRDTEGNPLKFTLNDSLHGLSVHLGKEYDSDHRASVVIEYETQHINQSDPANIWGSFGKGVRFFRPSKTDHDRRKQLWAHGEPRSSHYWYPTHDHLTDVRTTEIIATVQKPLSVVANGTLVSTPNTEGESVRFHWKDDTLHAPHQVFVVIGDYDNYRQSFEEIRINNYGYPDERHGTVASVVNLPDMMDFFSSYTGKKYPYASYSQLFVQDFAGWKSGVGASLITENMIDDETTHKDFLYLWDVVEGEALASQWFGSYIKPARWNDIWLSKAFSRHLSGLYNQRTNGNEEYQIYQHRPDLLTYLGDWNSNSSTVVVPDTLNDVDRFVNGNSPYAKGALVLNLLRKEMGHEKWERLIKTYVADSGNNMVTTADFIEKANRINGAPLDWFFEQWVYGVGHPIFGVSQAYNATTDELSLIVEQNQAVDSVVNGIRLPFFQGMMQIEIDDEIHEVFIRPQKKNTLIFLKKTRPRLINFDYEDSWIKEMEFGKTTRELLNELTLTTDIQHRVGIMLELTRLYSDRTTSATQRDQIVSRLFEVATSDLYWRNRLFAIWQLHNLFTSNSTDGIARLTEEQEGRLKALIKNSTAWVKANAINFLGDTRKKEHAPIYLEGLGDYSDRVTFMSAIALGKSKHPRAFRALMELPKKPSWKNQSLISALYGLRELQDPRAYDFILQALVDSKKPHWNLGTPIWDHRLAAANALVALNKVDEAYDRVYANYKDALSTGNVNDLFYNIQLISVLGDPRGEAVFKELKTVFNEDAHALKTIKSFEQAFQKAEETKGK